MFKGFGVNDAVSGSGYGYMVFEYGSYLALLEKMKKQYEVEGDDFHAYLREED